MAQLRFPSKQWYLPLRDGPYRLTGCGPHYLELQVRKRAGDSAGKVGRRDDFPVLFGT